jgi:hypothetical protein
MAVELTYLLRLNHAKAREILQPNFKQTKKTFNSSKSASSISSEIQNSKSYMSSALNEQKVLSLKIDNEIGKKISFLKSSFDFFRVRFLF